MAKYKIIPSSRTIVHSPISIGHKAEKGVEAIEFDLTAWVETYGSGTLTVIMRRWGDAIPYPIALEIDENNKATWVLSDTDTARAGMAYAQLSYIVGETVVKKSDIYTFRVMDSLTGEGDPPEAYESWLENLTHLAAEAMAEVLDIESIVTDKTLTVDGGIADAKKTGDELSALKADLGAQVGVFSMKEDCIIALNADPVSLTPSAETGWKCAIIDCVEGDTFVINASGGMRPRAWGFIDSSNNLLSVAAARESVTDLELTAPENAVKLIINDNSNRLSYKVGNTLAGRIELLEQGGSGLNEDAKRALLACVRKAWYVDENGKSYCSALEMALYGGILPNPLENIVIAMGGVSISQTKITYNLGTPIRMVLNPILTKCYAGKYKFSLGTYKDGSTYQQQIIVVTDIVPTPTKSQLTITEESGSKDMWTGTRCDAVTVAPWNSADFELVMENDFYVYVAFKKGASALSTTDKNNILNNFTVRRIE